MSDIVVDISVDFEQEMESTIGLRKSEQCITKTVESVSWLYKSGLCLLCPGGISRSKDKLHVKSNVTYKVKKIVTRDLTLFY